MVHSITNNIINLLSMTNLVGSLHIPLNNYWWSPCIWSR